jgi:hypothetical protein
MLWLAFYFTDVEFIRLQAYYYFFVLHHKIGLLNNIKS